MYSVLLVDDEILVRDAISENINWNSLGYELVGDCQNGKEAMEFVKKQPVDVVITDICMPYMDGMELSRFLHDEYPDTAIIIFSGFEEFEYAKKAIQYKVSEYMLKPVTAVELSQVLKRIRVNLEQNRAEEQKLEQMEKVNQEYKKNETVIRSKIITQLVTRTAEVKDSLEQLKNMGVQLKGNAFRVAVLDIDLYAEMDDLAPEKKQESALMAFVVYNACSEIMEKYQVGLAYQEGTNRVCLLFETNQPKELLKKMGKICREIQNLVEQTLHLTVSITIGEYVYAPEKLYCSYESAVRIMEYRYLLGGAMLLDMEEVKGRLEQTVSLNSSFEILEDAIRECSSEKMDRAFLSMEEELKRCMINRNRASMYLQQIVRVIDEIMQKFGQPQTCTDKRDSLLNDLAKKKNFSQALALVKRYAQEASNTMEQMEGNSSQRQARMALEYIRRNYADTELSLNSLCSYLCISTSHFSTIFKEATGETFMEVLIRTRMEKAKELLEHTTLKNYEIAERVGFSDPHYFSISFKKMTGKTPTEYAKERRNG